MKRRNVLIFLFILVFFCLHENAQAKNESDEEIQSVIQGYLKIVKLGSDLETILEKINREEFKEQLEKTIEGLKKQTKVIQDILEKIKGYKVLKEFEIEDGINKIMGFNTHDPKSEQDRKKAIKDLSVVAKVLEKNLSTVTGVIEENYGKNEVQRLLEYLELKKENEYLTGKRIRFGLLFGFDFAVGKYRKTSYFINEDDNTARPAEVSQMSSLISAVILYEIPKIKLDLIVNIPLLEIPLFSDGGSDKIDNIFNKLLDLGLGVGYPLGPNWSLNLLVSHSRIDIMEDGALAKKIFTGNAHDRIDLSNYDVTVPRSKLSITIGFVYKFGKSSRSKRKSE